MTPQILLTLTPTGNLACELPTRNGATRREIEFTGPPERIISDLRSILQAQLASHDRRIGNAASPTQDQIKKRSIPHDAMGNPIRVIPKSSPRISHRRLSADDLGL